MDTSTQGNLLGTGNATRPIAAVTGRTPTATQPGGHSRRRVQRGAETERTNRDRSAQQYPKILVRLLSPNFRSFHEGSKSTGIYRTITTGIVLKLRTTPLADSRRNKYAPGIRLSVVITTWCSPIPACSSLCTTSTSLPR